MLATCNGWQLAMALILDPFDFGSGNDVFHIVVHRPCDHRDKDAQSAEDCQPPNVPDHTESEHEGQCAGHEALAGVPGHQDIVISIRPLICDAFSLHVLEGVDVMYDGCDRKEIG